MRSSIRGWKSHFRKSGRTRGTRPQGKAAARRRSFFRDLRVEPLEQRVVLAADAANDEFWTDFGTSLPIGQGALLGNDAGSGTLTITSTSTTTANGGSVFYDGFGTYTYAPPSGFSGDDSFDYSIDDEDPSSDSATVTIHVAPRPNSAPTAGDDDYTINLGHNETDAWFDWSQYQPNLGNDSDPDYDSLSIVWSNVPTGWGSLGVGDHTFSYTIDDGHGGQDTGEIHVYVTSPPNSLPAASDDDYTITIGHSDSLVWVDWSQYQPSLGNDYDPDYDNLTIVSSDVPTWWSMLGLGDHTFSYTIDDGHGGQDTGEVHIHVVAPNSAPTGADDYVSGLEDASVHISAQSLVGNDSDPDADTLTVTGVGHALHGTTSFDAQTGQVTYSPNANWVGADSFTYDIADGYGGVNSATVHVMIAGVNDPPVRTAGNPVAVTVYEDSANQMPVSLGLSGLDYGPGGGSDEVGQTLTYTITAIPSFVTLWKHSDNSPVLVGTSLEVGELRELKYRTVPNANGSGLLQWLVEDNGGGGSGTASDNFSDSNGTLLENHTMDHGPGWDAVIGGWDIENNRARVTSTGFPDQALAVFEAGGTDYSIATKINIEAGHNSAGIAVRYGSGSGTFYFAQVDTGDQNFCIYYFNGTWYDLLASASFPSSTEFDYEIAVTVSGNTITATVNGGNQISASNCDQNAESTLVGMRTDGLAEFDDYVVNGGGGVVGLLNQSLAITVYAVNDAPVRTAGNPPPITVEEDTANDAAVGLGLNGLNYGPGGGSDEAAQSLAYRITAIPSYVTLWTDNGTQVMVNASLNLSELRGLKFKTVPNAYGSGDLTWSVQDNGGTASGGIDTLTGESLPITVFQTPLRLTVEDIARHESAGFVDVTFRLTRTDHNGVSVDFSTSDGSAVNPDDYEPYTTNSSGDLYFAPGEGSKTVTYILKADRIAEDDEFFTVSASNISEGVIFDNTGIVTILGDPTVSVEGAVVGELGEVIVVNGQNVHTGKVTVTFRLTRNDHLGVTVHFRTIDGPLYQGGAFEGLDYGTVYPYVTFDAGEIEKTVEIDILDDTHDEPNEFFSIELADVTYGSVGSAFIDPVPTTVTIEDNDIFKVAAYAEPTTIDEMDQVKIHGTIDDIDFSWGPYTYVVLVQWTNEQWVQIGNGEVDVVALQSSDFETLWMEIIDDLPLITPSDPITLRAEVTNPAGEINFGETTIFVNNVPPEVTFDPLPGPLVPGVIVPVTFTVRDKSPIDDLLVSVFVDGVLVLVITDAVHDFQYSVNVLTPAFPGLTRTVQVVVEDDDSGVTQGTIDVST